MIREQIKKICENADKFKDFKNWSTYSYEFVYDDTIKIEIERYLFFGFQSLELSIKEDKNRSFYTNDQIKLFKEERKLIYKTFKKQKKLSKKLKKEKKEKEKLDRIKKEKELLKLIKF